VLEDSRVGWTLYYDLGLLGVLLALDIAAAVRGKWLVVLPLTLVLVTFGLRTAGGVRASRGVSDPDRS
jgi:hypothetical protein